MSTESTGGSRPPRSNSVNSATAENPASEESGSWEEEIVERATECVDEFRQKYPDLADLPVSETPGRTLRREVVEEEYAEERVEGDREWEQGFSVERLDRVEPVTWSDALFEFLTTRAAYDDGVFGKFVDRVDDEMFIKQFTDCWTTAYGDEMAAKNKGAQRQLMGGKYPEDREESVRRGEFEEGIWSDDIATVLLTRTGSSVPGNERLAPVDHLIEVVKTWTEGVYDVVRNVCEYHLGLDSEHWGLVRGDDVHGVGDDRDGDAYGTNACYAHSHDGIYLDLGETELRDEFDTDEEVKTVLQSLFYKAIEKHLELCDIAEPEAHTPDEACEVMLDLKEPAGYATGYLRLDEDEDMLDREVEMQAFAAVEWAASRQRISRSQIFNEAADADLCKQKPDQKHGAELRYDHSGHGDGEIVCCHCGSGVGIEAETLTEHRVSEARSEPAIADGGEVVVGARVGESTDRARVRSAVEEWIEQHGEPDSIPAMLGELGVEPYVDLVEEVLDGGEPGVREIWGAPHEETRYNLEEIVKPDGIEEASSGGGGAETVDLLLPEQRLLRETRLRYIGDDVRPKITVDTGDKQLSTYNPETAAGWLESHGYRRPWHAELALSFTRHGRGLPDRLKEPVAQPPGALGGSHDDNEQESQSHASLAGSVGAL